MLYRDITFLLVELCEVDGEGQKFTRKKMHTEML